jgi:SAM-dependent methyltransferase
MQVDEFVLAELPGAPARVLEVGCGAGELAETLAGAGYDVLAVDPEAPAGPLFRRTTIEELDEAGPFDAVVASLSLHHVHDLTAGLDRVAALLRPGGRLVVDDFAWERLDAPAAAALGIDLADWRAEHDGLHTSAAMLAELERRFATAALRWEPFFHREARHAVDEPTERGLIAAGTVEPIGFRYVGRR